MYNFTVFQARRRINSLLTEYMDDDDVDVESPTSPLMHVRLCQPAHVARVPTPQLSTSSEIFQPPPSMWRQNPPPASVWGSQAPEYMAQYMQQPLHNPFQHQTPFQQQSARDHHQIQPLAPREKCSTPLPAAVGNAAKVLNEGLAPSTGNNSNQSIGNISGLSDFFNYQDKQ